MNHKHWRSDDSRLRQHDQVPGQVASGEPCLLQNIDGLLGQLEPSWSMDDVCEAPKAKNKGNSEPRGVPRPFRDGRPAPALQPSNVAKCAGTAAWICGRLCSLDLIWMD